MLVPILKMSSASDCVPLPLNCVPLSFEQLSYYIHSPISYDVWMKKIMPTGHPPELDEVYLAWNEFEPNHKLICIWERDILKGSYPFVVLNNNLYTAQPYIWIGREFKDYLPTEHTESNCHCALVFFEENKMILITTMSPRKIDSSDILVQEFTPKEFWSITFYIFEITNNRQI
jgi:hypothetical protein